MFSARDPTRHHHNNGNTRVVVQVVTMAADSKDESDDNADNNNTVNDVAKNVIDGNTDDDNSSNNGNNDHDNEDNDENKDATINATEDDSEGNNKDDAALPEKTKEERLLDSFPLTATELDRLLELEAFFSNDGSTLSVTNTSLEQSLKDVEGTLLPVGFTRDFIRIATQNCFVVVNFTDMNSNDDEQNDNDKDSCIRKDQLEYLEGIVTCLGRRGQRSVLDLLFTYCQHTCGSGSGSTTTRSADGGLPNEVSASELFSLLKRLMLAINYLFQDDKTSGINETSLDAPKPWLRSIKKSVLSRPVWVDWATFSLPQCHSAVTTFFHTVVFGLQHPFRPQTPPLLLPKLDRPSLLWNNDNGNTPLTLAAFSNVLGNTVSSSFGYGTFVYNGSTSSTTFSYQTFVCLLIHCFSPNTNPPTVATIVFERRRRLFVSCVCERVAWLLWPDCPTLSDPHQRRLWLLHQLSMEEIEKVVRRWVRHRLLSVFSISNAGFVCSHRPRKAPPIPKHTNGTRSWQYAWLGNRRNLA